MCSIKQSARIKGFTTLSKAIKNLTAAAKGKTYVKLRWDKLGGYSGYIVSQKINGSFKKIAKISGVDKRTYKVSKLKSGRTYRFRVRAYKVINGVTYYSGVSKTLTVKTN